MAYTFSLPAITDLSRGQRIALMAETDDVFIISGCPGSGKTTVALLRAKGKGDNPRHHYTVWANMLFGYLLNLSEQLEVSEDHFSTFYSWFYKKFRVFVFKAGGGIDVDTITSCLKNSNFSFDEFQLDEGQDLPLEVRCALSYVTKKLVICMDPAQDVMGECDLNEDEIQKTISHLVSIGKTARSIRLTTNWRNTQPIFEFAREIVPELNSQTSVSEFSKNEGAKPLLYALEGKKAIQSKILEIIRNEPGRNIGVFDESLHNLHSLHKFLAANGIKVTLYDNREHKKRNKRQKKDFLMSMSNIVLTTFISCKGLEFNTVIINNVSLLSDNIEKKKGYYVGCTRAQDRLILFKDLSSFDLPNWFQQINSNLYNQIGAQTNSSPF